MDQGQGNYNPIHFQPPNQYYIAPGYMQGYNPQGYNPNMMQPQTYDPNYQIRQADDVQNKKKRTFILSKTQNEPQNQQEQTMTVERASTPNKKEYFTTKTNKKPNTPKKELFTSQKLKEISNQIKSKTLFTSAEEQRKYEISQKLKKSKDLAYLINDPKNVYKSQNIKVIKPNGTELISTKGPLNTSTTLQVQRAVQNGESLKVKKLEKKDFNVQIVTQQPIEKKKQDKKQEENQISQENENIPSIIVEKAEKDIEILQEVQEKPKKDTGFENQVVPNDEIIHELNKLIQEKDSPIISTETIHTEVPEEFSQQKQEEKQDIPEINEIEKDVEIEIEADGEFERKIENEGQKITISPPSPEAAEKFKNFPQPDPDAILMDVIEGSEPISVYSQGQSYVLEKEESGKLPDYMFSTIGQKDIVIGEEEEIQVEQSESSSKYLQEDADDDDNFDPYSDLMLIRKENAMELHSEVSDCFKDDRTAEIINGIPKEMIKEMLEIDPDDIVDAEEKVIKNFKIISKSKAEKKHIAAKSVKNNIQAPVNANKVVNQQQNSNEVKSGKISVEKPPKSEHLVEVTQPEQKNPQNPETSQIPNPQFQQNPMIPQQMSNIMPPQQVPQGQFVQQNPQMIQNPQMLPNQGQIMMQQPNQFIQGQIIQSQYQVPYNIQNQMQFPIQNQFSMQNQMQYPMQNQYNMQNQNFIPNQNQFQIQNPNQFQIPVQQPYTMQYNNNFFVAPPQNQGFPHFQPPIQNQDEEINLDDYPEQELQHSEEEEHIKQEETTGKKDYTVKKSIVAKELQIPTKKKINLSNPNVQKVTTGENVVVERRTDLNIIVSDLSKPKITEHQQNDENPPEKEKEIKIGSHGITLATGETIQNKTRSLVFNPDDLQEDSKAAFFQNGQTSGVKLSNFDYQPISRTQNGTFIPSKPLSSFATTSNIFKPPVNQQREEIITFTPPVFKETREDEIFQPPKSSQNSNTVHIEESELKNNDEKSDSKETISHEFVLPISQYQLHPDQFNPSSQVPVSSFNHLMNLGKQKLIGIDSTEDSGFDSDQREIPQKNKNKSNKIDENSVKTEKFSEVPIWNSSLTSPLGLGSDSSGAKLESSDNDGKNNPPKYQPINEDKFSLSEQVRKRRIPLSPELENPISKSENKNEQTSAIKQKRSKIYGISFVILLMIALLFVVILYFVV